MAIRSEWLEVQMTELKSALQNLWSDGLYKIILSNAIKKESEGAAYRKVVLNRKTNGWQAEQYTEKQVFHENLKADQVRPFVEQALEQAFRQCSGWDGAVSYTHLDVYKRQVLKPARIEDLTEEQWDHDMAVNLKSTFLCTKGVIEPMKRRGGGVIINASSFAAQILSVGPVSYTHLDVYKRQL